MTGQRVAQAVARLPTGDLVVDRLRWWDLEEVQELERAAVRADPWTAWQFWSELAPSPSPAGTWSRDAARGSWATRACSVAPEADVQTVAVAAEEQGRGTGGCCSAR